MEFLILSIFFIGTPIACFIACFVFLVRIGYKREENLKLPPQEQKSITKEMVLCIVCGVMSVNFTALDIYIVWSLNEMVKHM